MRRRLALLLLPLPIALWFVRPHLPSPRPMRLHLGAAVELREADLVFQREQTVARDVSLHFPSGAGGDLSRTVVLPAGEYEVGIRLVYADGKERHITRKVVARADDELDVDLR